MSIFDNTPIIRKYPRFWSKVRITDDHRECWEWLAALNSKGYGSFSVNKKTPSSHCYSYVINKGPIPEGFQVTHRCDNPKCVNPNHLVAGTPKYNAQDSIKKGRNHELNRTHCPKGHEYSPENTVIIKGSRNCRQCINARERIARKRRRENNREAYNAYHREYYRRRKAEEEKKKRDLDE